MADATRPAVKVRHVMLFVLCLMYFIAYIDRVNISVAGADHAQGARADADRARADLLGVRLSLRGDADRRRLAGRSVRPAPRARACSSLLWASATILTGLSWSVASLVLFRVLVGIGEGGAFPTATRAFTFWLPVRERGFAQGITHSFARLGGAVTPPIVLAIVAGTAGAARSSCSAPRASAWTAVVAGVVHEHAGAASLDHAGGAGRNRRRRRRRRRASHAADAVAADRQPHVARHVVDFCYGWSLWVFLTWLPSYLADARGFKAEADCADDRCCRCSAAWSATRWAASMSDAIFRRTGDLRLARRTLLVVGLGGALAFMLPAVVTDSALGAVCACSAAAFFFLELTNAVLWTLPLDIAGQYAGTAGGMMNTGFGVAGMISPVVFGVLIERTGHYELPFFISAALLLVGAVCSLGIDPTAKVEVEPSARGCACMSPHEAARPTECNGDACACGQPDAALGAEVQGIDLRALDAGAFAAIHQAWLDHQVLLFRDQAADRRGSGRLQPPLRRARRGAGAGDGRRFVEGHPEIYVVSNVVQDGVADRQPRRRRSGVAHRHVVPARSAEGERALCARSAGERRRHQLLLDVRRVGRVAGAAATPRRRAAREARWHLQQRRLHAPGRDADRRSAHVARHVSPAGVRRIPRPDGAALYLGRRRNAYIDGLSLDESDALLDEIWAYATRDSLTWRHQWRAGDLVLWDNRCTMHRRDAFDPTPRRVMHRTQIRADSTAVSLTAATARRSACSSPQS